MPKSFSGERTVFLTNSVGKTRYPHTLTKNIQKNEVGGVPGGPTVKTSNSTAVGTGLIPSQGSSVCCEMQPKKKKTRKLFKKMKLHPYLTP